MIKFDESKPHSCTFGVGGIQGYEQNGCSYDARKNLISAAQQDIAPDYAEMHWASLKKLVEEKGGDWTDKAAAVIFLAGA